MIFFGYYHLAHPKAMMEYGYIPDTFANPVLWVKIVGVAFILAAISFILNKYVKIAAYLLAEALQNYVVVHTNEKKHITYLTFKSVEEYLPSSQFIKVHKSFIISASKIDSIEGNDIRIGQHHIPISRNLKDEVMERLLKGKFLKR